MLKYTLAVLFEEVETARAWPETDRLKSRHPGEVLNLNVCVMQRGQTRSCRQGE